MSNVTDLFSYNIDYQIAVYVFHLIASYFTTYRQIEFSQILFFRFYLVGYFRITLKSLNLLLIGMTLFLIVSSYEKKECDPDIRE